MRHHWALIIFTSAVPLIFFLVWLLLIRAPGVPYEPRVIVPQKESYETTIQKLKAKGMFRNRAVFEFFLKLKGAQGTIEAGGYEVPLDANAWQLAGILVAPPSYRWVTIPEGLRKEEIAERLAEALSWTTEQQSQWITEDTARDSNYFEGVYFPDTYLLPIRATGAEVAARLIARFNERFAPYASEAASQNIKWTTALKLASIVQREASDTADMPLIAGILWNRLEKGMRLETDATLQYARGNTDKGWWAPITPSDKSIDSPFNSYRTAGLPPHPISNPGIDAIAAVLKPAPTPCLFYLHGKDGETQCAKNYEEHRRNIERYL
jgi:UPF0755 protein